MLDDVPPYTTQVSSYQILADRLSQLAADTDRVGLHREATALATFAASVREGRRIHVHDA